MKQTIKKNKGWRPPKMTNFVNAFQKVIEANPFDVISMTDDELLFQCNSLLKENAKISNRTFERWKNKEEESPIFQEFCRLYKQALTQQKRELFRRLQSEPAQWQRFAWIIERKFSDFNLRSITENKNINTNLEVTNELTPEQKKLIAQRYTND